MENNFNTFSQRRKKDRNIQPSDLFSEYKTSQEHKIWEVSAMMLWRLKAEVEESLIVRYLKNVFKQSLCFSINSPCTALFKSKTRQDFKYSILLSSFSLLNNKPKQQAAPKIRVQEMRPNNFLFVVFPSRGPTGLFHLVLPQANSLSKRQ